MTTPSCFAAPTRLAVGSGMSALAVAASTDDEAEDGHVTGTLARARAVMFATRLFSAGRILASALFLVECESRITFELDGCPRKVYL